MRELAATGFMSNRGRQNVASFLVLDLDVDWRRGADWFECKLVDYDVTANWCNWVFAAGLTGGRLNRFNVLRQAKSYDPDGAYVKNWVPELVGVPTAFVHEPWLMADKECETNGARDYPVPCVDPSVFSNAPGPVPVQLREAKQGKQIGQDAHVEASAGFIKADASHGDSAEAGGYAQQGQPPPGFGEQ